MGNPRTENLELADAVIRGVGRGIWNPTDATKQALVGLMHDYRWLAESEGIATTLADALRGIADNIAGWGVPGTEWHSLKEMEDNARAVLVEFDRVSGSLKEG